MESIIEFLQLDYFTLIGFAFFLITIGLILQFFIVKEKSKKLHKNSAIVPQTGADNGSITRSKRN